MKCLVISVVLIGIGVAPVFADNLLLNGSFELPSIGNYWYVCAPQGACNAGFSNGLTPTDWTVTGTSVDIVSTKGGGAGWAYDGYQAIDLAGSPGPGGIEQVITTDASTSYLLSFWASSNGDSKWQGLDIGWGNQQVDTVTTPDFRELDAFHLHADGNWRAHPGISQHPHWWQCRPLVDAVGVWLQYLSRAPRGF